ncbi:major capsid protein [Sansalvadorimonas verongulae]|nr:major capsid protein [Sansalvadorimonas verongulae]
MLDIFSNDAFTMSSLTATINHAPHKPGRIGELGLFVDAGINTTSLQVESKNGTLKLLPTTERGAPATQAKANKRNLRNFTVTHIPHDSTILADEVQNVRAFGSTSALEGIQTVVNQRLTDIRANHEVTLEHLRLGAIKGQILDADGSIIYDLFDEFKVQQQTHDFAFSDDTLDVRDTCVKMRRKVDEALGVTMYTHLHAFCGAEFYDALVGHPYVKESYQRYQAGAMLRKDHRDGFHYSNTMWEEYLGQVEGVPFIEPDEAYVIPMGSNIFRTWFGPADFIETANTIGLPLYAKQKPLDFDKGVQLHTQSNPLPLCLKPRAVIKCTMS